MPIVLGQLRLETPVILAPMTGVTDAPFRRLARRLGVGLVVTEMVASRGVLRQNREAARRLGADGADGPLVVQLAGAEPEVMAEAARYCADRGADVIDINMGCPVKKVAKGQQAGAALMRDEAKAARLIAAVREAVALPVTLKMRLGWDADRLNAPRLARIAEDLGVAMITVHGRTRMQGFGGRADWDAIARVKAAIAVPVIANGDVVSLADAREILRRSRADGVMIGRGACGRPWFPGAVSRFLASGRVSAPDLAEQGRLALEHYEALLSHYGRELGARLARKHLGWYLEAAGADREERRQLVSEAEPARARLRLAEAFRRQAEREAA